MANNLISGIGSITGCCFLPGSRQLIFTELEKGTIGLLGFAPKGQRTVVSSGNTTLKANTFFNLDPLPGEIPIKSNADLRWTLINDAKRQMEPIFGARIVNLGKVDFSSITPDKLQNYVYSSTPISGNNDSTNQLVNGDVFAVRTLKGNVAKVRVIAYGSDIQIEWVTFRPSNPYLILGTGYYKPNDIAVTSDEKTAYITEQRGSQLGGTGLPEGTNLLKVDLKSPNRSQATVIYSNKILPPAIQQIFLDEPHQQIYFIEYPGRLLRIDLTSCKTTVVLDGLDYAQGLLISADLNYAYIAERTAIRRYSLQGSESVDIATGLLNPRHLTWADKAQSAMFVTQNNPNRVTIVDAVPGPSNVRDILKDIGNSPGSVAYIDNTQLLVCCADGIYMGNPMESILMPLGLFKGIGRVLLSFINAEGKADTRNQPKYPYHFDNAPFGGNLSINIDHKRARAKYAYYRVVADGVPRLDTWSDMKFNPNTGRYDILIDFAPMKVGDNNGFYRVLQDDDMGNSDLAMVMDSSTLSNKEQMISIEFANGDGKVMATEFKKVLIDNNRCFARIEMPKVNGVSDADDCGMLKYDASQKNNQRVDTIYFASHPNLHATYHWRIGKGKKGTVQADGCSVYGDTKLESIKFGPIEVEKLLGGCNAAAFYAILDVYAKATNGEYRLSGYDAHHAISFALIQK
jgi:hypothetical protein